MTLCHASSIVYDGRTLSWFGEGGATWSVPIGRVHAIREFIAEAGDVRWFVAFKVEGEDVWLQAPANANGMSQALTALGQHLRATLELRLEQAGGGSCRVVWRRD